MTPTVSDYNRRKQEGMLLGLSMKQAVHLANLREDNKSINTEHYKALVRKLFKANKEMFKELIEMETVK